VRLVQRNVDVKARWLDPLSCYFRDSLSAVSLSGVTASVLHLMSLRTSLYVKVKVKVTLEQATKAQRGSRGIALLFL